jgi:hypothetical protein
VVRTRDPGYHGRSASLRRRVRGRERKFVAAPKAAQREARS